MRKEREIFTQINTQNVPVNPDILDSLEQEDMNESILRKYIRELLTETSELPKEYFSAIDNAISSSQFWKEPNAQDDIDEYSSPSGSVMGSPAAEALSQSLHDVIQDVGLDIDFLIRSHYTDNLEGMSLHPEHPAWPDRWLIDAKWYVSKERPGRNTIDIELMTSETSDDILSELNSSALIRHIAQTIRHELVHYTQMKKQAKNKGLDDAGAFEEMLDDPSQVPKGDSSDPEWQKKYLSSHIEIDAHAHDAAEELIAVYDEEQRKDILRGRVDLSDRKLPNAILHYYEVLGPSHDATHKFMSKLYTQVERMS
jgi:rubrerythrin